MRAPSVGFLKHPSFTAFVLFEITSKTRIYVRIYTMRGDVDVARLRVYNTHTNDSEAALRGCAKVARAFPFFLPLKTLFVFEFRIAFSRLRQF